MKKIALLLMALNLLPRFANAQAICNRLSDRIESSIKEISYESASGIGDNSAPRESIRQLRIVASYSSLQLTLLQQQAAKCKPFLEPVTGMEYLSDALKCSKATASNSRTYDEIQQACDRKVWKRDQ